MVAALLLFLFHTLLVEVESWMSALWPALVMKWAVLRYPCPNSAGFGVGVVSDEVVRSAGERGGPESRVYVGEGVRSSAAGANAVQVRVQVALDCLR